MKKFKVTWEEVRTMRSYINAENEQSAMDDFGCDAMMEIAEEIEGDEHDNYKNIEIEEVEK